MRLGSDPQNATELWVALPGLAAGHISMLVFGDETRNFFLVIGQTVNDVRLAQNMAHMNDVILSPNCWQLCDRSMIEIERIPDQRAVKVQGMLPPQAVLVCAGPPVRKAVGRRVPRSSGLETQRGPSGVGGQDLSLRCLLRGEPLRLTSRDNDEASLGH